jgi:hypothetical protein
VPLLIGNLEHTNAAPDLYFSNDRTDAIRLLEALVAAGMNTRRPRANAWIEKKAWKLDWKAVNLLARSPTQEMKAGWLTPAGGVGVP